MRFSASSPVDEIGEWLDSASINTNGLGDSLGLGHSQLLVATGVDLSAV